jgi:urease gamma subunit
MNISPADTEKLLLSVAGMVARDRLARGVLLNYPESVALLTTWVDRPGPLRLDGA